MAILDATHCRHFTVKYSVFVLALLAATSLSAADLRTHAERTGYLETGRYAEVEQLCKDFHNAFPEQVRCFHFGTSPEGRLLWAMSANADGVLTAEEAQSRSLPVVLFQGGIHAGEIDGKDAGFLVLRELLENPGPDSPLHRQVMLFVPIFNVDGHERFSAWNRPNQRGPEEMGWRTTAQNYNLNRDYAKADSPEMAAMLGLLNTWDPLFYVDLHVTNGAKFRHDVSVQIEPLYSGSAQLRAISKTYQDAVLAQLNAKGSMSLPFYPEFRENDNPASGFEDSVALPRFSTGYYPLRNRFGVLVETHSWKPYPVRVKATAETIRATLALVATHGKEWQAAAYSADQQSTQLGGTPVALTYKTSKAATLLDFQGYRYTRTPSEVSGSLMTRYDESKPEVWRVPLYKDISVAISVAAPEAGYLVPPAFADLIESKLHLHGIRTQRLTSGITDLAVEQFHTDTAVFATESFESHQALSLTGTWQNQRRDLPAGSLFVPITQPKAQLLMALLEPQAPDSYLAWGFFNNRFERKEYMENYVTEEVAREMLNDPVLKAEFDARLESDKAFAASPQQRLEFFARRHSSWDGHYRVYPVLRTDTDPTGG